MESHKITEVTRWQTADLKEHHSLDAAKRHAEQLERLDRANEILSSGGSVADALREFSPRGDIDPVLERVSKDTKLVIPHWQMRETPGYQVREFLTNGELWVYGDAGSSFGPYGTEVSIDGLVRYAKDERTVFQE